MEKQKDALRDDCSFGTPIECYHRQQQVEGLVRSVKELDNKYDTRIRDVEDKLDTRISRLECKSDERDHTIESQINKLDKHVSEVLARNNTVIEGVTKTLKDVETSYKAVGEQIQGVTNKVDTLQHDVTHIEAKMTSFESHVNGEISSVTHELHAVEKNVEKEIHDVDNKGKMDVVEIMRDQTKSKVGQYLTVGGIGAGIFAIITYLIQHFGG